MSYVYSNKIRNLLIERLSNPFLTYLDEFVLLFWLIMNCREELANNRLHNSDLVRDVVTFRNSVEGVTGTFISTIESNFNSCGIARSNLLVGYLLQAFVKSEIKSLVHINHIRNWLDNNIQLHLRSEVEIAEIVRSILADQEVSLMTKAPDSNKPSAPIKTESEVEIQLRTVDKLPIPDDLKHKVQKAIVDYHITQKLSDIQQMKDALYESIGSESAKLHAVV